MVTFNRRNKTVVRTNHGSVPFSVTIVQIAPLRTSFLATLFVPLYPSETVKRLQRLPVRVPVPSRCQPCFHPTSPTLLTSLTAKLYTSSREGEIYASTCRKPSLNATDPTVREITEQTIIRLLKLRGNSKEGNMLFVTSELITSSTVERTSLSGSSIGKPLCVPVPCQYAKIGQITEIGLVVQRLTISWKHGQIYPSLTEGRTASTERSYPVPTFSARQDMGTVAFETKEPRSKSINVT